MTQRQPPAWSGHRPERRAPMTSLVAGGAGFIGSHLCERLLADGEAVICLDNRLTGRRANVEPLLTHPAFTFVEGDVVDPLPPLPRLDRVFHLASPASPPAYQRHPIETLRTNSEGTRRFLERAAREGARFLYACTSEVYGDPLEHPQREGYCGNVNPVGPRSIYNEAKRFGEAITVGYGRARGVDVRIVRVFNTYGPRMRLDDGRVVTNFGAHAVRGEPLTIHGDGSQTRSFQYVDDLVEGLTRFMAVDYQNPVNLGNPGGAHRLPARPPRPRDDRQPLPDPLRPSRRGRPQAPLPRHLPRPNPPRLDAARPRPRGPLPHDRLRPPGRRSSLGRRPVQVGTERVSGSDFTRGVGRTRRADGCPARHRPPRRVTRHPRSA